MLRFFPKEDRVLGVLRLQREQTEEASNNFTRILFYTEGGAQRVVEVTVKLKERNLVEGSREDSLNFFLF